ACPLGELLRGPSGGETPVRRRQRRDARARRGSRARGRRLTDEDRRDDEGGAPETKPDHGVQYTPDATGPGSYPRARCANRLLSFKPYGRSALANPWDPARHR